MEMEKQVFGKPVAGPSLTVGHREHFGQQGPARCFLVYHT